jgi:segregation and condensation protein B
MNLKAILEGLLFVVGDEGISYKEIKEILQSSDEEIKNALYELKKDYENENRGLRITFLGNTFKLTTKPEHKIYFEKLVKTGKNQTLSEAALEVLAIIAYNEPITRLQIEQIRGINSTQIVRKLLAMGLIKECGKADSIGRPNLYKTTNEFLDYFGLATIKDLPVLERPEEFKDKERDLYKSTFKEKEL